MGEYILVLENISKYYVSDGKVTPALHKIDLTLRKGELVAITGESGSGKTTLLNLISGSLIPDSGEIYYSGTKLSEYDQEHLEDYQKNQIGFVYQDFKLIPHYTVLENIMGAMLLQGFPSDKARMRAEEVLKQVGMEQYSDFKAGKLSAGQKQRLSIARVLAKESKIIIADEPTANLDKDTGAQIMELLKTMSKDHLVLIVTHNFEEAKGYASRMIRIHGGKIEDDYVLDQPIGPEEEALAGMEQKPAGVAYKAGTMRKSRITGHFLRWNLKNGIGKGALLTLLLLLAAVMSLVFFNLYHRNTDQAIAMNYDASAFRNMDDKRIIIRNRDDAPMTKEDREFFQKLTYVTDSELYDCVTDINYYALEGIDYRYQYYRNNYRDMTILRNDRFMRSASSLEAADLLEGRLPEGIDEIVVSSTDKGLLGKKLTTYFNQGIYSLWGTDCYCIRHLKVVGLAGGDSGQVYFSDELCDMFSAMYAGSSVRLFYNWNASLQNYGKASWIIPVIDVSLEDNTVALTTEYRTVVIPPPYGECLLQVHPFNDSSGNHSKELKVKVVDTLITEEKTQRLTLDGWEGIYFDENSYPYAEVSEALFYRIYDSGSSQMSVYIDDYVHTDEVLRQIRKAGDYIADSAYRLSRSGFDKVKEQNRKQVIFSALFSLFILGIGTVILVNALLFLRKKDYVTLINIGMNRFQLWRITAYELLLYTMAALAVTVGLLILLYTKQVGSIMEYLKYFEPRHYGYCAFYYMIVIGVTATVTCGVLFRMVRTRTKKADKV